MHKKINAVNKLFDNLDKDISRFKKHSNLKCIEKCGLCCTKKDIEASVLEFIPAANYLFQVHQDEKIFEKINNNKLEGTCIFYNPFTQNEGFCSIYPYRGLICRLFGFSANYDKNSNPKLVTCQILKGTSEYKDIQKSIHKAPIISDYYMKLSAIDFSLASIQLPINQAIKKAIEIVNFYNQYKSKRKSG